MRHSHTNSEKSTLQHSRWSYFSVAANLSLSLLVIVFIAAAVFFQWQFIQQNSATKKRLAVYGDALKEYESNNIYYDPSATITWLVKRQNPSGYFVANPDLLFEHSQLNASTLRSTRYAIETLRDHNALEQINRKAVLEYVLSNYVPDLEQSGIVWDYSVYGEGSYAGFRAIEGQGPAVRPTMDALMILSALGELTDKRLDLELIHNFILIHQNEDGGFWDEHYPEYGKASCLKCTSIAIRALAVLQGHFRQAFDESFKEKMVNFTQSCFDRSRGGYAELPGGQANDSYDTFRAFIVLWKLGGVTDEESKAFVAANMDTSQILDYISKFHYLSDPGAFSRYAETDNRQPSLKATHLIIWLARAMSLDKDMDLMAIAHYVISKESQLGQYGGDISAIYSSSGILRKLGISSRPLTEPVKPQDRGEISSYSMYLPYLFSGLALITLLLSHLSKRSELRTLNKALAKQASIDGLTGIFNRTKFEELMALEREKVIRYGVPLSLILFDIDKFKEVNDSHGHLVGDKVIQQIAILVLDNLREPDLFARWGGEEFIILTPGTALGGASQVAEKLRSAIQAADFGEHIQVTCSFGLTQILFEDSLEEFVNRTDQALYQAKQRGRNQVCAV